MAEYQLSFDGYARLFFVMAIIACGYGYVVVSIFVKDTLAHIIMLLGLVGLSAFFLLLYLWIKICGVVLLI